MRRYFGTRNYAGTSWCFLRGRSAAIASVERTVPVKHEKNQPYPTTPFLNKTQMALILFQEIEICVRVDDSSSLYFLQEYVLGLQRSHDQRKELGTGKLTCIVQKPFTSPINELLMSPQLSVSTHFILFHWWLGEFLLNQSERGIVAFFILLCQRFGQFRWLNTNQILTPISDLNLNTFWCFNEEATVCWP